MEVKIYGLYDPLDCKIRYIGRTSKKALEHRLIEHITKAKYFDRYYPNKKAPHRINWIRKILQEGREPKIKLLCKVEGWKESHQVERKIINKYKDSKNLTNWEDRGEGSKNRIIRDEEKLQISKSLKKFYEKNINPASKPILVYTLEGQFIKEYDSIRKFALEKNFPPSKIVEVLKGKWKQWKGYRVFYKENMDQSKLGELLEPLQKIGKNWVISSQAKQGCLEGSTTNSIPLDQ